MPLTMAGATAIGAGVQAGGMMAGAGQARRQYHRQKKLNVQQYGHQRMLNQQGHDLQMDMWNKTNYKAQLEHMRAAGLNPALMYGQAGQGGTTGSQGGGSAQGGSAAKESAMDMSNMMIAAQLALVEAQKDKTKEEGRLAGEKADAVGGYEKTESEARTGNYKASAGYKRLQGDYQKILNMYKPTEIIAELGKIGQETKNLNQQYDLTKEQWKGLVMEAAGKGLSAMNQAENIAANTKLTRTEEQLAWEKMDVVYNELALKGLDTEARLTSADAGMIRSKVEEELRPLELSQRKWEMWVNNITKIITATISGVAQGVGALGKGTR
jgi:hypothetical protein